MSTEIKTCQCETLTKKEKWDCVNWSDENGCHLLNPWHKAEPIQSDHEDVLTERDLFDKFTGVNDNLDQVIFCLSISGCPTDIYKLLSPVLLQAKEDIMLLHRSISSLWDEKGVLDEILIEKNQLIEECQQVLAKIVNMPPNHEFDAYVMSRDLAAEVLNKF